MKILVYDVVVIGGGPAGLGAAIAAKSAGAQRVVILEREKELGGILQQCIHPGFGLHLLKQDLTGPEYAARFIREVLGSDIDVLTETTVIETTRDRLVYAVNRREGLIRIQARAIVLAMGCRERTRGAIVIPGTRPAGIYTAGTAQRLINIEGYLPGRRIVILGSGDVGLIMARRLTLEGVKVITVLEALPYPGGLIRNVIQCLDDFNIPLHLSHTVTKIHGRERLEGVTIAQVDDERSPLPGSEEYLDCDTLLLSVGLIPENELSRLASIKIDEITGGPIVDSLMQTSVSGIFACGNVVHVHDLVDNVTRESKVTGEAAALYDPHQPPGQQIKIRIAGDSGVRYVIPHTVELHSPDKLGRTEIPLFLRVASPGTKAKIEVVLEEPAMTLITKEYPHVRPGEMLEIPLNLRRLKETLEAVDPKGLAGELAISVRMFFRNKETRAIQSRASGGRTITCVVCPLGCEIMVSDPGMTMVGYRCDRGRVYAEDELRCPKRVITTTVRVRGGIYELVPVRSTRPVPKNCISQLMEQLERIMVDAPIHEGDKVAGDLLGMGVDFVATRDVAIKLHISQFTP